MHTPHSLRLGMELALPLHPVLAPCFLAFTYAASLRAGGQP